jgi:multiple sugar transport system ATP-binding protein
MAGAVRIQGLTRRFAGNPRPSVDALDLSVAPGEVVCLVGPSGCGKSTTLRLVAGLDVPDAGTIHIDETSMAGVPPQDRDVAMVFQGFALYPHMKVREILAFPLKMRGEPAGQRGEAVERTAKLLSITHLLERRPGELSGGEQQRVAMGRAIVRKPRVFLFDEPLSNLDAALRAELRVELAKLLQTLDATALYVTHDQAEAMTLGDRIAVLRAGRLEQLDTPRAVYERPATTFVASFFGTPPMNLLDAERDGAVARCGSLEIAVPSGTVRELVLGIRPEHLRLSAADAAAPAPNAMALAASVVAVEPLGAETYVEAEFEGRALRTRVPGFEVPERGSAVKLWIDPGRVHWFDRKSGKAL